ncbi:MAG: hypothetical protein ACJAZP_001509 [Psychromonas sp.]|jgi:hypothetical protein
MTLSFNFNIRFLLKGLSVFLQFKIQIAYLKRLLSI